MNRRDQLIPIYCDECGSNETSRAVDCCDSCIVKMFANNPKEGSFTSWASDRRGHQIKNEEMSRVLDLVEKLADELAEMHNMTAIELESWDTARYVVELFYNVRTHVQVGGKKL